MLDHDADVESSSPTWMSFADLMTGLLGAFVLLLVGVMAAQLDMASKLEDEVQKRQVEEQKRLSLEQALAIPLASGRITLNNGRIGISGSAAVNHANHTIILELAVLRRLTQIQPK